EGKLAIREHGRRIYRATGGPFMKVAEKLYPLRERRGRGGSDIAIMFDGNFFLAVIASTILSFVIGGIWYEGPVLANAVMAALGTTEADKEAMRKQDPKGVVAGF